MGREDRQYTTADLYGSDGRPRASDIDQDRIFNCYFLAPIGALGEQQPDRIRDAIRFDPKTGDFAVRLYRPPNADERGRGQTGPMEESVTVSQDDLRRNIERLGLPPDKAQNFGMAVAAQISENGLIQRADKLIAVQGRGEDGGDRVFASFHPHGDKEPIFNTSFDVTRTAAVPMAQSFSRIEQSQQQQQLAQTQTVDDPSRGQKMG